MSTTSERVHGGDIPKVVPTGRVATGMSLNADDVAMIEQVRVRFELDNRSQAVRKALRMAIRQIESEDDEREQVA
jgi:metal-responsive CopG/Arc/MetJ family transcriptional regulator